MDDEAEHEHRVVVGGAELEVAEALSEAVSELELVEEKLEDDESSERGELLVIESELGESAGLALGALSGNLHGGDLLWAVVFCRHRDSTPKEVAFCVIPARFQEISLDFASSVNLTRGEVGQHDKILRKRQGLSDLRRIERLFYAIDG
jgi:hypothetical protein